MIRYSAIVLDSAKLSSSTYFSFVADITELRLAAKSCFDSGAAPEYVSCFSFSPALVRPTSFRVQRRLSQLEKKSSSEYRILYAHPTGSGHVIYTLSFEGLCHSLSFSIDALPVSRAFCDCAGMMQDDALRSRDSQICWISQSALSSIPWICICRDYLGRHNI